MKFITQTQKKRKAVSPVIATLLLIAIAVAAAIIVYAFVTGLIGGLSASGASTLVTVTGTLIVPTGTSPGSIVVTVENGANSPITGIQVSLSAGGLESDPTVAVVCMGETTANDYCNAAVAAACPNAVADAYTFCNSANLPVDAANPLPVGSTVSASGEVESGTSVLQSGQTYSFTITTDFANGGTHTQGFSLTAQL
jgi:flagellin-like protein